MAVFTLWKNFLIFIWELWALPKSHLAGKLSFCLQKQKLFCTPQAPECPLLGSSANTFCWQAPHIHLTQTHSGRMSSALRYPSFSQQRAQLLILKRILLVLHLPTKTKRKEKRGRTKSLCTCSTLILVPLFIQFLPWLFSDGHLTKSMGVSPCLELVHWVHRCRLHMLRWKNSYASSSFTSVQES